VNISTANCHKQLPFNDDTVRASAYVAHPIFFNSSFKVEVAIGNNTNKVKYQVLGGIEQ
jgi:hypothetical protein